MRPVSELINEDDPGWPIVQEWIDEATNKVEVLACDVESGRDAVYKTQVTTRSPMGSIVYQTGGILIDDGWIRILGAGSGKLARSLPDWNKGKTFVDFGDPIPFLLIADDAVGGFFALNSGGLGEDVGKIYYLAPDNLRWEPLDSAYSDFLVFCFSGDLDNFYEGQRWKNCREEVATLDGNKVYNFFPPMWLAEGKDLDKVSRKVISIEEQYFLNLDLKKQLGE